MVTEYLAKPRIGSDLLSFLVDKECSEIEFDLLRFIGRHPHAKFNFYVISQAFRVAATELRNALGGLVGREILGHQTDDNGLITYSLSTDEKIRAHVSKLASLDWSVAISLKKEMKNVVQPLHDRHQPAREEKFFHHMNHRCYQEASKQPGHHC